MDDVDDRIRALPCWRGPITIAPLSGGLSNENYLVADTAGRHVVRFGRDYPFHHVLREREVMAARAAADAGLGPAVLFAAEGAMVTAYLGARTLGEADVRTDRGRISTLVRRFHCEMQRHVSGPGFMFWVFHTLRDYARVLAESPWRDGLPAYLALADELEAAQVPLPIVYGHNDLLPANILDDGDRLWLIDFEYAGFSTAMFDLAGLASNAGMSPGESESLLAAYFGAPPDRSVMRAHAAMQCASLLREAMWGMVSALHLKTPGVDFARYAADNLDRLELALDSWRSRYGTGP